MQNYDYENMDRPSPTALLNPMCDPIFKGIFTQERKESDVALNDFISTMIGRKVVGLQRKENEPAVETLSQMRMSFDVSVSFDDGECADIECQCRQQKSNYDYPVRSEIQVARLLNNNAKRGSNWNAGKVYQITVANFEFEKDDKSAFAWYTMRSDSGHNLGDRLNVIVLDLVKIKEYAGKAPEELTDREKWAMYFACAGDEKHRNYINKLVQSEEGIMAAETVRKYMSEEDANWFTQNSYDIGMRDYNSGLENAEKRGMQHKAIEAAKSFYANGVSLEIISKSLGMTIEQVQEIVKDVTVE